jgi:eukaryotic-like serine/threonine-protein kinase
VKARKRTAAYVARKWLRRHRYRAAIAAAFAAVLCAGAVWSYVSIAQQRDHAATQAAIADAVNAFILQKLLTASDPAIAQGREPTLRQLLERASDEVPTSFRGQPLVEAGVRQTLGRTYLALHDYDRAGAHIPAAYELCRVALGEEHPTTLRAATLLAFYFEGLYQVDRASPLLEQTLERQRRALPDDHPDVLETVQRLANVRALQRRHAEAESLLRRAWEGRRKALGEANADTIWSLSDLGAIITAQGRADESEPLLREALRLRRATQRNDHPDTLNAEFNLACNLLKQRKFNEAEALLEANARVRKDVLGEAHPARVLPLHALAELRKTQGRVVEAEALYRESFVVRERASPRNIETLQSHLGLVETLAFLGRHDEAAEHLEQIARLTEEKVTTLGFDALWFTTYASALARLDHRDEARGVLRRALEHARSLPTPQKDAVQVIEQILAELEKEHAKEIPW